MAEAANIMVQVGADIDALKQGMQKGAKSVGEFSSKISPALNDAATKIAKVGAAASIAAAGGLLAMTKSATSSGRELKILSQISNTSIQEFQNLSSAAAEFGITSEKLADQLKDVKDRVGDFLATGGGPMSDFFDNIAPKVGVTAEQFKNLSGAQSLQLYITSLEKANLSQAEMTFYLEAMASDLTQLAPLFANNGALISENEKRIKEMGLALSDLDVMQLEEGAKAFTRMKESSAAAANVIGAKLSPFVVAVTEKMDELSRAGGDFGNHVDEAIKKAFNAFGFLGDRIHEIRFLFNALELAIKGIGLGAIEVAKFVTKAFRDMGNTIIWDINQIVVAINKIPGVSGIPLIEEIEKGSFSKTLDEWSDKTAASMMKVKESMDVIAFSEYPSQGILEFYQSATDGANKAAEAAAAAHNAIIGGEEGESKALDKEKLEHAERLAEFDSFLAQKMGVQLDMNGLINKQWGQAAAGTAGAMKSILGTMSTQSRKAFEISKAWAIGDAIVSTAQGVAKGVALGWPMGVPAVAWAAATGLAQINQIKNQKFGGSGGAAARGQGAPATAPNPIGVGGSTGSGGAQQGQTLTLAPIDPGALFSGANVQMLADRLADFTADGGTLVTR